MVQPQLSYYCFSTCVLKYIYTTFGMSVWPSLVILLTTQPVPKSLTIRYTYSYCVVLRTGITAEKGAHIMFSVSSTPTALK